MEYCNILITMSALCYMALSELFHTHFCHASLQMKQIVLKQKKPLPSSGQRFFVFQTIMVLIDVIFTVYDYFALYRSDI